MSKATAVVQAKLAPPRPKMESVHVLFLNPAPVTRDSDGPDKPPADRETTPWFVSIPILGVAMMATNQDGPICGYWPDAEAKLWAITMYLHLKANPDRLHEIQMAPEWANQIPDGYKLMTRVISIPVV